jgi:DNA-binding NtrC family response regulator
VKLQVVEGFIDKVEIQGTDSPAAVGQIRSYANHVRSGGHALNIKDLERAMLLSDGPWLQPTDFPVLTGALPGAPDVALPAEGVNLEDLERSLVVQALERAGGNQTRAATLLGLNRDQIRYRIEKFSLGK